MVGRTEEMAKGWASKKGRRVQQFHERGALSFEANLITNIFIGVKAVIVDEEDGQNEEDDEQTMRMARTSGPDATRHTDGVT